MSNPPLKSERKKCHSARDEYFKCLDENNDDYYKCTTIRGKFESNCPKSWQKHFEKVRNLATLEKLRMPDGVQAPR